MNFFKSHIIVIFRWACFSECMTEIPENVRLQHFYRISSIICVAFNVCTTHINARNRQSLCSKGEIVDKYSKRQNKAWPSRHIHHKRVTVYLLFTQLYLISVNLFHVISAFGHWITFKFITDLFGKFIIYTFRSNPSTLLTRPLQPVRKYWANICFGSYK